MDVDLPYLVVYLNVLHRSDISELWALHHLESRP